MGAAVAVLLPAVIGIVAGAIFASYVMEGGDE
jgi:hypothetical protein